MKVFVAGASGAVGRRLVAELVARGHTVTGTTHTPHNERLLRSLGATPILMDALDARSVRAAVTSARPEVIVHELTALSDFTSFKRFDEQFAMTNRLRTEGLDHLLTAARIAGAGRIVVQSYTGWNNERSGGAVKTEEDALDADPPAAMRQTLAAIQHFERTVRETTDLDAIALRYGSLYGPGTSMGADGYVTVLVRARKLPVVGDGAGVWSFLHVHDAAVATAIAVERGAPGIYNVVDDEPAPVAIWLPYLAEQLGAKPPRHLPVWVARPFIGEAGISVMTRVRGSANARAKCELGWQPSFASWRQGFRDGLTEASGGASDRRAA